MRTKIKRGWLETTKDVIALGFWAILLFLLIQLGILAISMGTGLAVAAVRGWEAGAIAAVIAYLVILKLLYLTDLVSMISSGTSSGRVKKKTAKLPADE